MKKNLQFSLSYFLVTIVTLALLAVLILGRNPDIWYIFWIFLFVWPVMTANVILKKINHYSNLNSALLGISLIILLGFLVEWMQVIVHMPAI
jgi:hypothetical protein